MYHVMLDLSSIKNLTGGYRMSFKNLRETKFKRLTDFADAIGENISTVSMWENKKSVPRTKTLTKIAEVLGVSTDEVINSLLSEE